MPDKRDIHQAKSKGRHKPGGRSTTGSRAERGTAMVTGPDTAAAVVGTDRSMKQGTVPPAGGGRNRKRNGRS